MKKQNKKWMWIIGIIIVLFLANEYLFALEPPSGATIDESTCYITDIGNCRCTWRYPCGTGTCSAWYTSDMDYCESNAQDILITSVAPEKSTYSPGETATITVKVKNAGAYMGEYEKIEVGIIANKIASDIFAITEIPITPCQASEEFVYSKKIKGIESGSTRTIKFYPRVPTESSEIVDGRSNWDPNGAYTVRAAVYKCCYGEAGCSYPYYVNKAGRIGTPGGVIAYASLKVEEEDPEPLPPTPPEEEGYFIKNNECIKTTDSNLIVYDTLTECEDDISVLFGYYIDDDRCVRTSDTSLIEFDTRSECESHLETGESWISQNWWIVAIGAFMFFMMMIMMSGRRR